MLSVTAITIAGILDPAMPQISWAASTQTSSSVGSRGNIAYHPTAWNIPMISQSLQDPTQSQKRKPLINLWDPPAPRTHSLPRLFPCLHSKNLPPVSLHLPGKQGTSFTCMLALGALSRRKSTFIHRTTYSLHSVHFTISSWAGEWAGEGDHQRLIVSWAVTPECKGLSTTLCLIKSPCVHFYEKKKKH